MPWYACLYGTGFLTVGQLTVDADPLSEETTDNLDISHVTVWSISNQWFTLPISIETFANTEDTTALIDCGAEGLFVNNVISHKWRRSILLKPIKVRNIDGTYNEGGSIKEKCLINFTINGRTMTEWFYVTTLSDQNLILGLPCLEKYNLIINWKEKTLEFQSSPEELAKTFIWSLIQRHEETMSEVEDTNLVLQFIMSHIKPTDQLYELFEYFQQDSNELHIRRYSPVQQMEHKYRTNLEESTLPTTYTPWKKVFEQKASEQFPDQHPWDCRIELKDGFVPKWSKPYTLGPGDQKLLDAWVKEQLKKGYIRWLKSPQASGFFFVQKKDTKKKCLCQDYQYLNWWTKPNAYPIPLISNLMLKLEGSQYFMKLNIQWWYNNIRLKQGDDWKAAFITNRGLFELTVCSLDLWIHPQPFRLWWTTTLRNWLTKEE